MEMDEDHIVAAHRFGEDADFYRGHFPGNPITPGVLLLETMAQAGVVAHGIYLLGRAAAAEAALIVFTDATVEFASIVRPGERVLVRGRKLVLRRSLLRAQVEVHREAGDLVCSATIAGMRVPR